MTVKALLEKTNHELVVRILFKLQLSAVLHELLEFYRVTLAQLLERSLDLLFLDIIILVVLVAAWETLPRQTPPQEI